MHLHKSTKVALVDNHALFRKGMLELVNGFDGFEVTLEAENGKDLIGKLCQEELPDIILLDICMPQMDGFETAKWLLVHYPHIKILALSMCSDEEIMYQMLKNGVDGYLLKSSESFQIREALETLRVNGSYYSGSVIGLPPRK